MYQEISNSRKLSSYNRRDREESVSLVPCESCCFWGVALELGSLGMQLWSRLEALKTGGGKQTGWWDCPILCFLPVLPTCPTQPKPAKVWEIPAGGSAARDTAEEQETDTIWWTNKA